MSDRPTPEELLKHRHKKRHKRENSLRDVILGGQDGLVNALGIILGISAAGGDMKILIATVLAATFAESVSMGAVAYTSSLAQKDYYDAEREKEMKEIESAPQMEREEIRQIYEEKGFSGKVLEEVVEKITSDKKIWLDVMMAEELNITQVNTRAVLKTSVIVTVATVIGHLIPLLPFFFFAHASSIILSIIVSGLSLFAVGAFQAYSLVGNWFKSGTRLVLIGLGAALVGYLIASIFHTSA